MNTSYLQTQRAAHLATFPARTPQNARLPLSEAMAQDIERLRRNFDLCDAQGNHLAGCEQAAVDALGELYRLTPEQAWGYWLRHAATLEPR
jgi:hypothetical protein